MNISQLIKDFLQQNIQSEAEVRSKLIVPLLELLGYEKDCRAEEFPVYGYEGGKPMNSKAADFLQFTSNSFDKNRGKSLEEQDWVYKHSLLIFEAKKPSESILVKGQPVFYAAWTRSVAYIISNGVDIEGYIVNANYSDSCAFACKVSEIPEKWEEINRLSYANVLQIKNDADDMGEWATRGMYDNYKNTMLVRCNEELINCCDRSLNEFSYEVNIYESKCKKKLQDMLDDDCKIITSEPGGGKSFLMLMLMREYLSRFTSDSEKIPVLLEGRYYGREYENIVDGIYEEFRIYTQDVTKELIKKRLQEGGFVVLFDALDEIQYDNDILIHSLHQLKRSTNNTIVVTSRMQNYNDEFAGIFKHYSLEPLDDSMITELLDKYSSGKMNISVHQIPERLLEIIRIPLFLKMFVIVSKDENYNIPTNHAALFDAFVSQKMREVSASMYDETIMKTILGEYAFFSFKDGECTNLFVDIIHKKIVGGDASNLYEKIWETGLVLKGSYGMKYCHKAVTEYFVAFHLSRFKEDELLLWMEQNLSNEKYEDVICYLTGILSNQQKQAAVLDYMESHDLKMYLKALKTRRNFNEIENDLNIEYARSYYEQLLKTYATIIQTHFGNIKHIFDGFSTNSAGKACICGSMDYHNESINMIIYNGNSNMETVNVSVSGNQGIHLLGKDGVKIPVNSSVMTNGRMHQRFYNLNFLTYGFDSCREIAVDIIKHQLTEAIKQQNLFDLDIDVLLIERIEIMLKKLRRSFSSIRKRENLSLYSNNLDGIVNILDETRIENNDIHLLRTLCEVLKQKAIKIEDYLDIKEDQSIELGRTSYEVDEVYSNKQLENKVNRILVLSTEAIERITNQIVPVFASRPTRKIGVVYRNNRCKGVNYIKVKVGENEEKTPIIEFSEEKKESFPEVDIYYLNKLKELGKNEQDILECHSSLLFTYFGDNVFHDIIYGEIKASFERLFGK